LFDIGIAGPICGFVVAVPVLAIGLSLSKSALGTPPAAYELNYPLIFKVVERALTAAGWGHRSSLWFDHLLLHPMAIAAWGGMFATALNLLPGGRLGAGHILFAIAPRAHRSVSRISISGPGG